MFWKRCFWFIIQEKDSLKRNKLAPKKLFIWFQLNGFANREISELEWFGQQQRVTIAKQCESAKVLLLDESYLPWMTFKKDMQFGAWNQKLGITFIFVTHDQEEALAMSDEILFLNEGKIQQSGSQLIFMMNQCNDF